MRVNSPQSILVGGGGDLRVLHQLTSISINDEYSEGITQSLHRDINQLTQ